MNGVIQKNFDFMSATQPDIPAAQLPIETGRSDKDVVKIILSALEPACDISKEQHEEGKILFKISDQQPRVAQASSEGHPHTTSSAGGR